MGLDSNAHPCYATMPYSPQPAVSYAVVTEVHFEPFCMLTYYRPNYCRGNTGGRQFWGSGGGGGE